MIIFPKVAWQYQYISRWRLQNFFTLMMVDQEILDVLCECFMKTGKSIMKEKERLVFNMPDEQRHPRFPYRSSK